MKLSDRLEAQNIVADRVTIDPATECWEWQGSTQSSGYSRLSYRGRTWLGHRFSYEAFHDDIPNGMQIDHLCRNRICLNPDHLEPVTQRTNILRGSGVSAVNASKQRCPQGHPYSVVGTDRICRICRARNQKRRRDEATDIDHGTVNGYKNLGCRCHECRAANTAYETHRKSINGRLGVHGPLMPRHGTRAYYTAGCRCDECREAERVYVANYRARKKAA